MADAGRILIIPKGNYNPSVSYEMLDLVFHNDTSWIAKKPVIGVEPSDANSAHWARMTGDMSWRAELDKIVDGTTPVGKAKDADTVDGYHASDFAFGIPNNSAKYVANATNCPNGFKDIRTKFGRNISVYVETNVSGMPTSGSYWTVYITGTGIVNHVIAVGNGGMYHRTYYDDGGYDTGWMSDGVSPYFTSGETILDWASNPNGVYKKFVIGGVFPSDVPTQAEGFVELKIDEQGLRRKVTFYQYGTFDVFEREIFNGAWRAGWRKSYFTTDGGTLKNDVTILENGNENLNRTQVITTNGGNSYVANRNADGNTVRQVAIFSKSQKNDSANSLEYQYLENGTWHTNPILHTGTIGKLREYLNVYADSSNAETYSSFIQNANGTHVRHVTDANNFDEFFIKQGNITYAKMVNGAWSETDVLHTGNKPTGTYTGNGDVASRTIQTGGMGNACIVYGTSSTIGNVMSLITWGGTISEQGGKVTGIASSEARFIDGGIVLNSTSQFLNESGVTYTYQVL